MREGSLETEYMRQIRSRRLILLDVSSCVLVSICYRQSSIGLTLLRVLTNETVKVTIEDVVQNAKRAMQQGASYPKGCNLPTELESGQIE